MRNLKEHPITRPEVIAELKAAISEADGIGSIRPVILAQFLVFIEGTPDELVKFMFSIDPTWDELEVELEVSNDK